MSHTHAFPQSLDTEHIIEVHNLKKNFGKFSALTDINLELCAGEVHGFLGPNGAGKSTTIRILLGLMHADGGSAKLFGSDPWKNAPQLHKNLAYVPGDVSLWPTLTGGETIDLLARVGGQTKSKLQAELIERFQLDPSKQNRQYSKGNRQKVALIAAFAAQTPLLIFDEPTSGLDPLMESVFQTEVQRATTQGATVLLSSHILAEVENLADQLTIVRTGRTIRTGTLAQIRAQAAHPFSHLNAVVAQPLDLVPAGCTQTSVKLEPANPASDTPAPTPERKENNPNQAWRINGKIDNAILPSTIQALSAAGIISLDVSGASLEELFLDLYRDQEAETC